MRWIDVYQRCPFTVQTAERRTALQKALAAKNIFVWSGHVYAVEAARVHSESIDAGGVVRIGPVHYNSSRRN